MVYVYLEQLIVAQLVNKCPCIYGIIRYKITAEVVKNLLAFMKPQGLVSFS
jgi:hypothetical protein